MSADTATVTLRRPTLADGGAMWEAARDSGALDLNSPYAYLMWAEEFADASVVAELDGRLVGFVMGFRPPTRPEALFVWQVAVDAAGRGQGLATRMLDALMGQGPEALPSEGPRPTHLEATVTPSNAASLALFRGMAKRHGCACEERTAIPAAAFPGPDHESEDLLRIGPFRAAR